MKIIVDLLGGFGNQLFGYAFAYAMSKEKNTSLIIDSTVQDSGKERAYELDKLNVKFDERLSSKYDSSLIGRAVLNKARRKKSIGIKTQMYLEKEPMVFDPEVFNVVNDTCFRGYWQTEKYFVKYREDLLKLFTPKNKRHESVENLCEQMAKENSVSLHVRRGDYINIGCNLDMDFYKKAIDLICEKVENPVFYVFSDDVEYCKEYFSKYPDLNVKYPEYESDNFTIDDMLLMSNCKHNIIANSSFSWWGAWLNKNHEKIVVCPELGMWKGDFYPESWTKIKI